MEICHHPGPILRTYEALVTEGERSRAFAELLLKRSQRATRLREKLFPSSPPPALSAKQFEALRASILRFKETIEGIVPRETQATQKAQTIVGNCVRRAVVRCRIVKWLRWRLCFC